MKNKSDEDGVYLYCIVGSGENTDLGDVGLEDEFVYTVSYRDIGAVVHRCAAEPYETDDWDKAKDWTLTHQYVIDMATELHGTVIPLRFDTIFKGDDASIEGWLREKYDHLKATLQKFKGKAEYGIQVYLEKDHVTEIIRNKEEVANLKRSLERKPKGSAYLLKKRIEKMEKIQRDAEMRSLANRVQKRIAGHVDEMRLEKIERDLAGEWRDKLMILNLSCIVQHNRVKALGDLLGEINGDQGVSVRFTGPWPPYSFVSGLRTGENRQA